MSGISPDGGTEPQVDASKKEDAKGSEPVVANDDPVSPEGHDDIKEKDEVKDEEKDENPLDEPIAKEDAEKPPDKLEEPVEIDIEEMHDNLTKD
jgi:hypothetical protein